MSGIKFGIWRIGNFEKNCFEHTLNPCEQFDIHESRGTACGVGRSETRDSRNFPYTLNDISLRSRQKRFEFHSYPARASTVVVTTVISNESEFFHLGNQNFPVATIPTIFIDTSLLARVRKFILPLHSQRHELYQSPSSLLDCLFDAFKGDVTTAELVDSKLVVVVDALTFVGREGCERGGKTPWPPMAVPGWHPEV